MTVRHIALTLSAILLCGTGYAGVEALDRAPWIGDGVLGCNSSDWYEEDPAPEFRAEFVLPEGVTATKIHFACAGFGWFGVQGAYMNADGLDTLWSVYDKTIYAKSTGVLKATNTLDVSSSQQGFSLETYPKKNVVFVKLGNGFYNVPPLRFWGSKCFREALAHGRPCFKLAVDGVKEPLVWKWRKTNVVRNSVYLGTEVDATRPEDSDWKPASVVKGPKGKIVEWADHNPGMDSFAIHHGTAKWLKAGETQVVDFGVNSSGVPQFCFEGEQRGSKIEIVYGERLNADGSVNVLTQTAGQIKHGNGGPGAPSLACQRDVYVCRGPRKVGPREAVADGNSSVERFSPPFTWHVFRYAEIRGARKLLDAGSATRYVRSMVSTDSQLAPAAKEFKASNADLGNLHEVCQRTFQANLVGGVQSDCPGRERLGYGGDIVATCEAMCLNFSGMKEIYLKILRDYADEAEEDGWITETAPYVGIADKGFGGRAGPISWALVVPVLMDTLLRHYPDAADRVLGFYPVCTRYIALVAEKFPEGIIPKCIGDHEAIERAPDEVTATAHWHEFVRLTAKFARQLGKKDDAERFEALAEKIKAAFQDKFVRDGVVANGTQSAQAIGLFLGLVPKNQIVAAEARLVKAVEEKDYAPMTGIFSTRYMLIYLSEHGKRDVAEKIVLHKGYPGWLHMLERGATTLWESWEESDDVYSNCHPMFGSVDEWILRFAQKSSIRDDSVPVTGFTAHLTVDCRNVTADETLWKAGPAELHFRMAGNIPELATYDLDKGNYLHFPLADGTCPVLEATIARKAGRVGIPLGCLKGAAAARDVTLNFDGVHFTIVVDGWKDDEMPVPWDPVVWPVKAASEKVSSRVKFIRYDSPARTDAIPPSPDMKPITGSAQFWTPADHNAWVGDVVCKTWKGRLHVFYLNDRRHHGSRDGQGGHQFAHISSGDLVHWVEHPMAVQITRWWETVGTGTPFEWEGKLCLAYGLHTDRFAGQHTCRAELEAYEREHGEEGVFSYAELKGLPFGGTYASSVDGIHFEKSDILVTKDWNPSIVNLSDGRLLMGCVDGLAVSDRIGGWKTYDAKIPCYGDCPCPFEWNGRHYVIQGFCDMAVSLTGRPGTYSDCVATGDDIYDGVSVPMVAEWPGNRRLLIGWLNHMDGWGGWLCFRELVQRADGTLGTKWVTEIAPPVEPRVFAAKGGEPLAVRYRRADGTGVEIRVDPAGARAQFSDFSDDRAPGHERTLAEIAAPFRGERIRLAKIEDELFWMSAKGGAVGKIHGLDAAYKLKVVAYYDVKCDITVFDAEIAGNRTLVFRRRGCFSDPVCELEGKKNR